MGYEERRFDQLLLAGGLTLRVLQYQFRSGFFTSNKEGTKYFDQISKVLSSRPSVLERRGWHPLCLRNPKSHNSLTGVS